MYKCLRCGIVKKQKNDLRRHYKRKRLCDPIVYDIEIEKCLNMLENNIKSDETEMLKTQNKILKEQLKILQEQISELITKVGNNNTTINITTNNFNINDYKNTDYTLLSENELNKCIKNGNVDIVRLIKTVHFNEKYPENHNIKVENASSKRVMVLEDKKFVEKGRGYDAIKRVINQEVTKIEQNANERDNDKMVVAVDKYLNDCVNKKIDKADESKKLFNLMYNKKDMINKTHLNN